MYALVGVKAKTLCLLDFKLKVVHLVLQKSKPREKQNDGIISIVKCFMKGKKGDV